MSMVPAKKPREKRRRGNAVVSLPRPAYPAEVLVRMRLGFTEMLTAALTASTTQLNSPFSKVLNWAQRSSDFVAYRVVACSAQLTVLDTATGGVQTNGNKTYASTLFTGVSAFVPPTSANQILELPNADVRPYNMNNARSQKRFRWRSKDLNSLVFGPTGSAPPAESVIVVMALTTSPTGGTGTPQFEINGWMDVEFRGLAVL